MLLFCVAIIALFWASFAKWNTDLAGEPFAVPWRRGFPWFSAVARFALLALVAITWIGTFNVGGRMTAPSVSRVDCRDMTIREMQKRDDDEKAMFDDPDFIERLLDAPRASRNEPKPRCKPDQVEVRAEAPQLKPMVAPPEKPWNPPLAAATPPSKPGEPYKVPMWNPITPDQEPILTEEQVRKAPVLRKEQVRKVY